MKSKTYTHFQTVSAKKKLFKMKHLQSGVQVNVEKDAPIGGIPRVSLIQILTRV